MLALAFNKRYTENKARAGFSEVFRVRYGHVLRKSIVSNLLEVSSVDLRGVVSRTKPNQKSAFIHRFQNCSFTLGFTLSSLSRQHLTFVLVFKIEANT